jgi:outer membrane protein TolC
MKTYCHVSAMAAIAVTAVTTLTASDVRHLTLKEAVHLAIAQNRALKIARLKVRENQEKRKGEHAGYFPQLTNQSNALHFTDLQIIELPAGSFGTVASVPIPTRSLIIPQGNLTIYSSGTMLAQPLTQLIRVHAANRIAAAELAASREDLRKAENQVALDVHNLYFGILIARLQKKAAEQESVYASENLRESEEDIRNGAALRVAAIQGRATLLESEQSVLTTDLQLADLTMEFNDLLGLPLDTRLELDPAVPQDFDQRSREDFVQEAWGIHPEVLAAEDMVRRAKAGVTAAKSAYLPDITAYARYSYQNGVPFLVRNFGTFGFHLDWDVFDFGKRRAAVRERAAQLAQAEENLERLKDEVAVGIERAYNKVQRTRHMVEVADEVVKLREEGERLAGNQLKQGVLLVSEQRQATANTFKAEADYLQASLGHVLAWAELEQAVGRTPGI